MKNKKGFTLVEVLLVVVIIAILAAIVIIAINPARQIAQANNTQRSSDVKTILDAVHEYAIDRRGTFPAGIATSQQVIGSAGLDLCDELVPTYIATMPFDPNAAGAHTAATPPCGDYDTGYVISMTVDGRLTVAAPGAEQGETVAVTR